MRFIDKGLCYSSVGAVVLGLYIPLPNTIENTCNIIQTSAPCFVLGVLFGGGGGVVLYIVLVFKHFYFFFCFDRQGYIDSSSEEKISVK